MIEKSKHKFVGTAGSFFAVICIVAIVAGTPSLSHAGSDWKPDASDRDPSSDLKPKSDLKSKSETINLTAGQSWTINHLNKASGPEIRVIDNPHALVVHAENAGELVLLGAERGKWKVIVERDDGAMVAYNVNVAASADPLNPLKPGVAPQPASNDESPRRDSMAVDSGEGSATIGVPDAKVSARPVTDGTFVSDENLRERPRSSDAPSMQVGSQQASASAALASDQYRSDPRVGSDNANGNYDAASVNGGPHYLPSDGLSLMTGTSQIVDFPRRLKRISIADSTIADIQVTSPYQLNLIGHKPGFTTLAVWDDQGQYQERQVRIEAGGKQQVLLNVIVAELDRTRLEHQGIDLSVALAHSGLSLVSLPGQVATPYSASSPLSSGAGAATGIAPGGGSLIPLLLSGSMTYGLSTLSSAVATQTFFQFLESHNLARILAQPHLLASSGQTASFISGGEIPIVLAQALNTSIVFKQFGTQINFLPTVVGLQDIELLVKTEVSEPDYAHGVALFGFQVPAFVTRRADTLVRLRDNQTLIIAGLLLHDRRAIVQKVPYLGDLPYAGAIFRNTYWQDSETDLVMAVVPQIVKPLPAEGQVFLPTRRGPLSADEIRTQELATPDASRPRF
jgi:pilus assembly protein CpaC